MQGEKQRTQNQRNHCHPGQFHAVDLEEVDVGCALSQIDDATQVAEQRHLDQRTEQADDQQHCKHWPDLLQVIGIEGENTIGRSRRRGVTEYVDQFFKTAIKHLFSARVRALL
ncbi:hypothetical protein D9M73_296180 [compost metagenome]